MKSINVSKYILCYIFDIARNGLKSRFLVIEYKNHTNNVTYRIVLYPNILYNSKNISFCIVGIFT